VYTRSGGVETLYYKDLLSGALIMSIVERSKDYAIKRSIDVKSSNEGVSRDDIERAVNTEFKENEIFPKPIPSKIGLSCWTTNPKTSSQSNRLCAALARSCSHGAALFRASKRKKQRARYLARCFFVFE
jgi:hypothetical protein